MMRDFAEDGGWLEGACGTRKYTESSDSGSNWAEIILPLIIYSALNMERNGPPIAQCNVHHGAEYARLNLLA
jgi:hypothetical protein